MVVTSKIIISWSLIKTRLPQIIATVAIVLMAMYGVWFDFGRHAKTNSARFDLGNMEQIVWNLSQGHGFTMTDPYGIANVSRFAFHADPFLILLVPFYAIWPQTETLLLLQVLVVASGGIAVWLISRKLLPSTWWAALFVGLYAVNPSVQWSMSIDVHAVTFAIPLILWGAWALLAKRWRWLIVFVVLAMLTKEQVGLSIWVFGLYAWFVQKKRRWGMLLTILPIIWSLTMLLGVVPNFRPETVGANQVYQTAFGNGAGSIAQTIITKPWDVATELLSKQNAIYGWQLFAGSGIIGVFSPWWLAALPDLVINGLSLKPSQHVIIAHYASTIAPWILLSTMVTTAWVLRKSEKYRWKRLITAIVAAWLIGWSAYAIYTTSPLPFMRHDQRRYVTWKNPYASTVIEWSKKIPTEAAVSVTNNVGAHFARREQLYSFPLGIDQAEYLVVLERHATPVVATNEEVTTAITALRQNPVWKTLEQTGDLTILHRR